MARPTKLTPEAAQKIVALIRQGAYDWVAAQAAGINPATFRRWMAAGRAGNRTYAEFAREVDRARAEARVLAEIEVRRAVRARWLGLASVVNR